MSRRINCHDCGRRYNANKSSCPHCEADETERTRIEDRKYELDYIDLMDCETIEDIKSWIARHQLGIDE